MILSKSYKKSIDNIVMSEELKQKIADSTSADKMTKKKRKIIGISQIAVCIILAACSVYIVRYLNYRQNIIIQPEVLTEEATLLYNNDTNNSIEITEQTTGIELETNENVKEELTEAETKKRINIKNETKTVEITEINTEKAVETFTEASTSENKKEKVSVESKAENTDEEKTGEAAEISMKSVASYSGSAMMDTAEDTRSEEKIVVKEPESRKRFTYIISRSDGGSGDGGSVIIKRNVESHGIPKENIMVESTKMTENQYSEMLRNVQKLAGFEFKALPYDADAAICAAMDGDIVLIQYIYEDDSYINFRIAEGKADYSADHNNYDKTEVENGLILKSDKNGSVRKYHLAVCKNEPVSFSIYSDKGLSKEEMVNLADSVK